MAVRAGHLLGRAFIAPVGVPIGVLQPATSVWPAETRISRPLYRSTLGHLCLFANSRSSCSNNYRQSINHSWSFRKKLLCVTAGSCLFFGLSFRSKAFCNPRKFSTDTMTKMPSLKLYQYKSCPYCCKARAYMDYYGISYEVVEVNPLTRSEIKFSKYKKVPFLFSKDGIQINDSSLLISVLHTFLVNNGSESLHCTLDLYPEMTFKDKKGQIMKERGNKYFVMYGKKEGGGSLAERREEREWREWVDDKLVHAIPPNIYRTWPESLQAFEYIARVGNFSKSEKFGAKYCGAVIMYLLSKRLRKRYKLKDDVRQSLYDFCNEWTNGIGPDRKFMGGAEPDLADLAVYGVLSSLESLDTFFDMMEHTMIAPWYFSLKELLQERKMNRETPPVQ